MDPSTFSDSITDALGWTLLHAVWQGFALVLPVAILLHVLRNQSSALRYRVGVAGLLAQVLASVATFGWLYKPAGDVSAVAITGVGPQTLPVNWHALSQTLPWPAQAQQFLAAHLGDFVFVYFVGVLVFALRLAGGWLYLQRLSRTATLPASDRVNALVQTLGAAMQLKPMVRVRESARVAVPMVVGILKPMLLLPVGLATNLSMAEVEAVLAHELAHVKRYDYAVNLLQSVVEVLYFFHPALWWLSARVREEREHCCDDLAVQTIGGNGRILATALAHVEELRLSQLTLNQLVTPTLAMALTDKRQLLLHRVRRVLGMPIRPYVSNGSLAGLTLATLLLLSASVYAVQQQPQPKPKAVRKATTTVTRDNTTFSIADKKIKYVVWKGQTLPASRVAQLQKLYDQVMAGQLNLDNVEQPNRDILLEIIEATYSSHKGMENLEKERTQIAIDKSSSSSIVGFASIDDDEVDTSGEYTVYKHDLGKALPLLRAQKVSIDSMTWQLKLYRHSINDSLPLLQADLTKLQYANAQLHAELAMMKHNWQVRSEKMRDPLARRDQLYTQRSDLQKRAVFIQKLTERPSLLSAKQTLANELTTTKEQIQALDRRIDSIKQNELMPDIDRIYSIRRREAIDSLRVVEGEIIYLRRQLNIEPVDGVYPLSRPPEPPRPPKVIRGTGVIKPAVPLEPPVPRPAPKP